MGLPYEVGAHSLTPVSGTGRRPWRLVATFRRFLLALVVLGQTLFATWYLLQVLPYHGGTWVEIGLAGLFSVLYAWIAVGFWTAVYGFLIRLAGGDRWSLARRHDEQTLASTPWPGPLWSCPSTTSPFSERCGVTCHLPGSGAGRAD